MNHFRLRTFAVLAVYLTLAACGNGIESNGAARIDGRVDSTMSHMFAQHPATQQLAANSYGMLVMPLVTEAGMGFGAGFGRGALLINEKPVDYYAAATASAGFQIGAQQFSHVLFFMTREALNRFRASKGWALGADAEYTILQRSDNVRADTTTTLSPVVAVIFAQAGLKVGAALEGIKYTRIIP